MPASETEPQWRLFARGRHLLALASVALVFAGCGKADDAVAVAAEGTSAAVSASAAPAPAAAAAANDVPAAAAAFPSVISPDGRPIPPPLAGDESLEPQADGRYTQYALERLEQRLFTHLQAGEYAEVTEAFTRLRRERTQTTGGFNASTFVFNALDCRPGIGDLAATWLQADPDAQVAHLLYGSWCITEAWRHRGDDWAHKVTEEGWRGHAKYLQKARTAFERALELDPEDYISATEMITVTMGYKGDRTKLYEWFNRATTIYPDYYDAYRKLAYALRPRWHGVKGEAWSFVMQNINRGPQFPLLLYGWARGETDDWNKPDTRTGQAMLKLLETYRDNYPDSGEPYEKLSVLYANFGNRSEALAYAKRAVELDPSAANRYNYALRLQAGRNYAAAIAELDAAIALNPLVPGYWEALGSCYFYWRDGRDNLRAIAFFTRAIELGSTSRWPLVERGRAYLRLKQTDKAIADLEKAIEERPEFGRAYYFLGTALFAKGDREAGEHALKLAVEYDEKNRAEVEKFLKRQEELREKEKAKAKEETK